MVEKWDPVLGPQVPQDPLDHRDLRNPWKLRDLWNSQDLVDPRAQDPTDPWDLTLGTPCTPGTLGPYGPPGPLDPMDQQDSQDLWTLGQPGPQDSGSLGNYLYRFKFRI